MYFPIVSNFDIDISYIKVQINKLEAKYKKYISRKERTFFSKKCFFFINDLIIKKRDLICIKTKKNIIQII